METVTEESNPPSVVCEPVVEPVPVPEPVIFIVHN